MAYANNIVTAQPVGSVISDNKNVLRLGLLNRTRICSFTVPVFSALQDSLQFSTIAFRLPVRYIASDATITARTPQFEGSECQSREKENRLHFLHEGYSFKKFNAVHLSTEFNR